VKDSIDTQTYVKSRETSFRHGDRTGANETALGAQARSDRRIGPEAIPVPKIGPSLPSHLEQLHYKREAEDDFSRMNRLADKDSRKRQRRREEEAVEDLVPKEIERRGRPDLEKRQAVNAKMKDFRDRDSTSGLEMDDNVLLGGGDDFESVKRRLAQGSDGRGKSKHRLARESAIEEKKAAIQDKVEAMKAKDTQTMEMFKALAKERFG